MAVPPTFPIFGIKNGVVTVTGNKAEPGAVTLEIQFPDEDSWDVRITRNTDDANDNQIIDGASWQRLVSLGSHIGDDPYGLLNLQKQHTLYEMKYIASETLSGNIQKLNARAVAALRHFDAAGNFIFFRVGNNPGNPANIVMDILTGYSIQNHEDKVGDDWQGFDGGWIKDAQIDFPSFVAFRDHCNGVVTYTDHNGKTETRPRYSINMILDTDAPIIETCQSILSMCRARLIINKAGKFAIMLDEKRDTPRQMFTPANSWGFSGSLDFVEQPHAFRVNFVSPELGYQKASIMVYNDTHTEKTAKIIEDLDTFGVTNWHQAALYGRYMMAQGIMRRETFTMSVDTENLVVQVGDRVELQHDVPGFGGIACRVTDVTGTRISIDQHLASGGSSGKGWVYTLRAKSGAITTGNIPTSGDNHFDVSAADAAKFSVDDLVVIGERKVAGVDKITEPFLVTAIRPTNDLKAELTLAKYEPAVYDVDTQPIPPWNPSFGQDVIEGTLLYTSSLTAKSALIYKDRYPFTQVDLSFKVEPAAKISTLDHIIVRYTSDNGGTTDVAILPPDATSYSHIYSSLGSEFPSGRYQVIPVSQLGFQGQGKEVASAMRYDVKAPAAVTGFKAEYQTSGNTLLSWNLSPEKDVVKYQLFYSATGTNPSLIGTTDWKADSFSVPSHQEGTYYIKAVDSSTNESTMVSSAASWPVPGTVAGLQIHVDNNKAVLKWDLLTDKFVNQYLVYYSKDTKETDQTKGQLVGVTDGKTDTFPLTTVDGTYWLVARNQFGNTGVPARTSTFTPGVAATNLVIGQQIIFDGRFPFSDITLNWKGTGAIKEYRVYFRDKNGVDHLIVTTPGTQASAKFSTTSVPEYHSGMFIVQPVTKFGTTGTEAQQNFVILKDKDKPKAPEAFFSNIAGTQIELNWQPSRSTDIEGYEVRYSPLFGHPKWTHGTHVTETDHITLNAAVPARTGTYMLRAVDTSGNYSDVVYQRSAIAELPGLNVIAKVNDGPTWPGTPVGLTVVGDHLETDGSFSPPGPGLSPESVGTYTYKAPFDLGKIYSGVRIVSKMEARGVHTGDYMAKWTPLAIARPLAGAEAENWDAWMEYRTSDSPTVMADWVPLSSSKAVPIAGGSGNWSDWRRFYVADITARFIQFRIVTRSYELNTKVVVSSGEVEIDMPDRTWSTNDVNVVNGEVVIPISPAFREIHAAAVSIDNITSPAPLRTVQARVTNKTTSTVTVQFFDASNLRTNEDGQIDLIVTGFGQIGATSI